MSESILQTKRLLLRPWKPSDAEELFKYAKDPKVGPIAGWRPHTSAEYSREVITKYLSAPETYAVVLRETGLPIGSVGLMFAGATSLTDRPDECELGYWIGVPYWGRGLIPEAVREVLRHAFEDLGVTRVWCGYYDGNVKSKRVQEKCGFTFSHVVEDAFVPQMNERRKAHITSIKKEDRD